MSLNFRADLHCHTSCSDGSDTPNELLIKANQAGLKGVSITDHDTIAAYDEAMVLAKEHNVLLLPGVEFSATFKEYSVHILGYAFSLKSAAIKELCLLHQKRRYDRNHAILKRLKEYGIDISYEELISKDTPRAVGRPHIALALLKRGVVSSVKEAFQKYLGDGRAAYVSGAKIEAKKTIEVIHAAGGKAVLAHPHLIRRGGWIRQLLKLPFDGLEAYYAKIPKDQEKKWVIAGKERGWIITGGSDYHGVIKEHNPLGASWVGEETFHALYEHYLSHHDNL